MLNDEFAVPFFSTIERELVVDIYECSKFGDAILLGALGI